MASDKFGASPVAPLYNATGRNPRDITPSPTGQPLGSVGSSGSGGKNFDISNQAPQKGGGQNSNFGIFSPYNYMSPFSRINTRHRVNKLLGGTSATTPTTPGSGTSTPGSGTSTPGSGTSTTSSMSDDGTTQTNTFNNPGGGNFNPTMIGQDFSVNKGATAGGDINNATGADVANQYNQDVKLGGPAQPAKNTGKPRGPYAPKTPERKTELATKRAAKKENPKPPATKTPRAPRNNTPAPGASPITLINGPSNRRSR